MAITVEAVYENGVLKPTQPLSLKENDKVRVTIEPVLSRTERTYGLLGWTGSVEDLDHLIEDAENDPQEGL
jgi:predicted DNA-binding antitoxin AbrB/MazE fold protein